MSPTRPDGSELLEALRALISDIEGMYEGEEYSADTGQSEEFFGPFSISKWDDAGTTSGISVSWPNLAISLRNANRLLSVASTGETPDGRL